MVKTNLGLSVDAEIVSLSRERFKGRLSQIFEDHLRNLLELESDEDAETKIMREIEEQKQLAQQVNDKLTSLEKMRGKILEKRTKDEEELKQKNWEDKHEELLAQSRALKNNPEIWGD